MAGKSGRENEGIIIDINVTPLVDVVLVLLIIFMVTARLMMAPSIPVDLPKASTGKETEPSTIAVTLDRGREGKPEQLYLNGKPVTTEDLQQRIPRLLGKKRNLQAIISAHKEVTHGKVIWLLDLLRQLGIEQYAININPEAPEKNQ